MPFECFVHLVGHGSDPNGKRKGGDGVIKLLM